MHLLFCVICLYIVSNLNQYLEIIVHFNHNDSGSSIPNIHYNLFVKMYLQYGQDIALYTGLHETVYLSFSICLLLWKRFGIHEKPAL